VEPERLPADFCEVRKKKYTKLAPSKGTGIPVPQAQLGTLYVAKLSKSVFDAVVCTQLLVVNAYKPSEIRIAKQAYHRVRDFLSNGRDLFGDSRFVRQSLKSLSITLRLTTKRYQRYQDDLSEVNTELPCSTRNSQYPSGLGLRSFYTPKG